MIEQKSRNYKSFIEAYMRYAEDEFCPSVFHKWTGFSIISAAMERKCWLEQGYTLHFPNIYTLLVGHPGTGKSTAISRGAKLLEFYKKHNRPAFKIIPNQTTEAAFIKEMNAKEVFRYGHEDLLYSSGFFYADEASSSALKNEHGDFYASVTAMYDCPDIFRKRLASDKEETVIQNASLTVLSGTTFDFLKRIVNEVSVMGGLASRFIYVIHHERKPRKSKWSQEQVNNKEKFNKLYQDLSMIAKSVGSFKPTQDYIKRWEDWQPKFDEKLIAMNSPRLESLMARKTTHIIKLSMILSMSDNAGFELSKDHWDRAVEEIEAVTKDNAMVVSQAMMADKNSQSGITQVIGQTLKYLGGDTEMALLKHAIIKNGNPLHSLDNTLKVMHDSRLIEIYDDGRRARLVKDPNTYL